MSSLKIHFVISPSEYAQEFGKMCIDRWGQTHLLQASYVVSLGGDGTALVAKQEALSANLLTGKQLPVYGIDCSNASEHVGMLTNRFVLTPEDISDALSDAKKTEIYPLRADCELLNAEKGKKYHTYYGFNEIAVKVRDYEMTYLDVDVDSKEQFFVKGDGVLVATSMGKSGYYYNLGGQDFSENQHGIQTIACREKVNKLISDSSVVSVKVRSLHRPTCVMRDCNLISDPIVSARIYKARIPLTVLKDRQKD